MNRPFLTMVAVSLALWLLVALAAWWAASELRFLWDAIQGLS